MATFPVTGNSGDTGIGKTGNGHMHTFAIIDASGNLQASTHTWDSSPWGFLTGFHGAALVVVADANNDLIDQFCSPPYGVQGGQSRVDTWTTHITTIDLEVVSRIIVTNIFDPQNSFFGNLAGWVKDHSSELLSL